VVAQQQGFSAGLDLTSDDTAVAETALRRADNCRLIDRGAVTKRRGTQRLHASALPAAVKGGFGWQRATATDQLLAVSNGALYTTTYPTLPTPATWTAQAGALSASADVSFAAFRDGSGECVYLADGGLLNKWDGTTLTVNIAGSASVARVWVYNQRLYGISGTNETLYYSAINNGDSLGNAGAGGGSATIRTFGAEKLVAGAALGPVNIFLHEGGVSLFEGLTQDDIAIAAGTTGLSRFGGTQSPAGVVALDGVLWVPTPQGIALVSAAGVDRLDTPERPDPTTGLLSALSASSLASVRGVRHEAMREVWLFVPAAGVYCWHEVLRAWTGPWDGGYLAPATTCLFAAVDDTGAPCVLRGDASGWVSRCDAPGILRDNATAADTASGTPYTLRAKPRRLYFTTEGGRDVMGSQALRHGYVHANLAGSTTATFTATTPARTTVKRITGGVTPFQWDVPGAGWDSGAVWDGETQFRSYAVALAGTGEWVDVTITDNAPAASVYATVQVEGLALGRRH
jgi:hypothetical protein